MAAVYAMRNAILPGKQQREIPSSQSAALWQGRKQGASVTFHESPHLTQDLLSRGVGHEVAQRQEGG